MNVNKNSDNTFPFVLLTTAEDGKVACKTYGDDGTGGILKLKEYSLGTTHTYKTVPVANITDIGNIIVANASNHRVFNIRGRLRDNIDPNGIIYRRKDTDKGYPPETVCFEEHPVGAPYLCIDVDKVATPAELDLFTQPIQCIKYVITLLPEFLQHTTCFYQLSNSAGCFNGAFTKVHLWFWVANPKTDSKIGKWANKLKHLIDPSPLRTVQPAFTANPILQDVADPFPNNRFGYIKGKAAAITFPSGFAEDTDDDLYDSDDYDSTGVTIHKKNNFSGFVKYACYEEMLTLFGDGDGCGGFHNHVYQTAWRYFYENDDADDDVVYSQIHHAMLTAYADPKLHSKDYVKKQASPYMVKPQISNAKKKVAEYNAEQFKQKQKIGELLPHYDLSNLLDAPEAEKRLLESIKKFFVEKKKHKATKHKAIKGGAGLGKSTKTQSYIADMVELGYRIEVYVPSHKLGGEWFQKLGEHLKEINEPRQMQIIKGREMQDTSCTYEIVDMCRLSDIAATFVAANQSVFPNMCLKIIDASEKQLEHQEIQVALGKKDKVTGKVANKCGFFEECAYIKQFSGDWGVRIMPHSYLSQDRGMLDAELPDIVVIDESFYQSQLVGTEKDAKEITLKDIQDSGWNAALITALVNMKIGFPVLKELRSTFGGDLNDIMEEATVITAGKMQKAQSILGMGYKQQVEYADNLPIKTRLNVFLEVLRKELATGRDEAYGIVPTKTGYKLMYRRDMTRIAGIPTLLIDADSNPEVISQFFEEFEYEEIPVKRKMRVIQVWNTRNSYNHMLEEKTGKKKIADIQLLINRLTKDGADLFVAGPQSIVGNPSEDCEKFIEPRITVPEGSGVEHFGNLRGVDIHKDKAMVLIISRNQPPLEAVENTARALYYDTKVQLKLGIADWMLKKLPTQPRMYSTTTGFKKVVDVQAHPDAKVQNLLELVRECESVQAIDRIRLIWGVRRAVYILSNLVLPLPVSHLVTWNDCIRGTTKLREALETCDGVLPVTAEWLAESLPYIFSKRTARDLVKTYRADKTAIENDMLASYAHKLKTYRFSQNLHSSEKSICVSLYDADETKARLETLLQKKVFNFES